MHPDARDRPADTSAEWHIASILVHLRPERSPNVRAAVASLGDVEVHAEERGRMVVTVEGPHEGRIADRMTAIHLMPGVMSAVMVFHHAEPMAARTAEEVDTARR
ncbi:nitrate reductase [Azospirillum brasilense]|uniref:Chaperone NapD n=1 Tax=Azospirillum brasilense TaxID=192 RepID=A0A0P0F4G2_AZOBR|nr:MULTISPECIES: chaperone NapD [Azospirillum]ALJ38165.1 nitrate reductase [Azospirillum brasilense]MDW7556117.1 chaperone NapD [Azospirillum brasilense]MDW7596087.1 chaperone NapD [Azospirillum brasilense]MDW7631035.1 chaperone NapD [Azospirillum brasilense]MDX5955181.1 chaperone NapD [Azospirillum brasilense]